MPKSVTRKPTARKASVRRTPQSASKRVGTRKVPTGATKRWEPSKGPSEAVLLTENATVWVLPSRDTPDVTRFTGRFRSPFNPFVEQWFCSCPAATKSPPQVCHHIKDIKSDIANGHLRG